MSRKRPTREIIERVAAEEAKALRVPVSAVLGMHRGKAATEARKRAVIRVMWATGCSPAGLAEVWGMDRQIPHRYLRQASLPKNSLAGKEVA